MFVMSFAVSSSATAETRPISTLGRLMNQEHSFSKSSFNMSPLSPSDRTSSQVLKSPRISNTVEERHHARAAEDAATVSIDSSQGPQRGLGRDLRQHQTTTALDVLPKDDFGHIDDVGDVDDDDDDSSDHDTVNEERMANTENLRRTAWKQASHGAPTSEASRMSHSPVMDVSQAFSLCTFR